MLPTLITVIISYLIGSFPSAYVCGRLVKGIDIRQHGSGNVGATNALRTFGKGWGITVLLLDISKGMIAVMLVGGRLAASSGNVPSEIVLVSSGVSCILGHNWPVFLGFKGGKGMASSLGVLLAFAVTMSGLRLPLVVALCGWIAVFFITRIVSLASLTAALVFSLSALFSSATMALKLISVLLTVLIIVRHRTNIQRLMQNREPRLSFRGK